MYRRSDADTYWMSLVIDGKRLRQDTGVQDRTVAGEIFAAWQVAGRSGVPRSMLALGLTLILILSIVLLATWVGPLLTDQFQTLASKVPQYVFKVRIDIPTVVVDINRNEVAIWSSRNVYLKGGVLITTFR